MSIDIDWDRLTSGPEAEGLAETVRSWLDDRFQQLPLPHFIRTVRVQSFNFGSIVPEVTLKDIGDPLPEFYETEDEEEDEQSQNGNSEHPPPPPEQRPAVTESSQTAVMERSLNAVTERSPNAVAERSLTAAAESSQTIDPPRPRRNPLFRPPSYIDTAHPIFPGAHSFLESLVMGTPGPRSAHGNSASLSSINTMGIPGGTANMHHFNSPLTTGFAPQTPLVAMAGGRRGGQDASRLADPFTSPQDSNAPRRQGQNSYFPRDTGSSSSSMDTQVLLHVRYSGDIRLSLTAELLLDYPMPSFVGIPLRMHITGLVFDGVAVVAHIGKRICACFLGPEESALLVDDDDENASSKKGGLLQEIKVESEIGQNDNGKQGLKNMGKVEKFVLEQVRKIFEEELVHPSFWTFLI